MATGERESVNCAPSGLDPSIDELFDRYYPVLIAWCRRRVDPRLGDPEDFVHQAYLRCRQSWTPGRRSKIRPAAYLFRAVRSVVIDGFRSFARRTGQAVCLDASVPDRRASPPWETSFILDAVASLGGRPGQVCRALLQGQTPDEARRELGLSPNSFAVYLSRARAQLRKSLGS